MTGYENLTITELERTAYQQNNQLALEIITRAAPFLSCEKAYTAYTDKTFTQPVGETLG